MARQTVLRPGRRSRGAAIALWVLLCSLIDLPASPVRAQTAPEAGQVSTLIADRVELTAEGTLVASGNVEAMQGDARLKASSITYDPETEQLFIEGPIVLKQGENTVVLADSAELTPDLRDGLMRSARVVIDQQMQLGAVEINRVGGRYTQLYRTVASSCQVCAAHPVPLWQIRAQRVVHDSVEKQLYFDHAIFEVMGLPVMYIPQLRMPDPTLKRATGFLTPSIRTTDQLGFGVKIPYFITLGDHRDLTITPYISTNWTRTIELRYRQAFRKGAIEINGAVSRDDLSDDQPRGYLFAAGAFELPRDFDLVFNIESTSDPEYMLDYDYSDQDRLSSSVTVSRVNRDRIFVGEVLNLESLRSSEDNMTQPFRVTDANWRNRIYPAGIGGVLTYGIDAHGHQRRSTVDVEGRDVGRITGLVDWRRTWTVPWGLRFDAGAGATVDYTEVAHDSNYEDAVVKYMPYGFSEIRWPWIRTTGSASHLIEPVVQLVWSPNTDENTPRDESTQLEFDEGNLWSLSRFPASDVRERGLRANIGVNWARYDPTGWSMKLTFGRILRTEDLGQFDGYDIFDEAYSDWLVAMRLSLPNRLELSNRASFDGAFDFAKNEMRLDWTSDMLDLGAVYVWMEPSPAEGRYDGINEWTLDADWQMNTRWRSTVDWRYDLELERAASARLGLEYRTECATFDFSVRRRFTSTEQLQPSTDFDFSIELAGFGDPGSGRTRPVRLGCRS